jgi:hypothetical protein
MVARFCDQAWNVVRELDLAGVDFQDGDAADFVRAVDQHLALEPAGPQQGRSEN